MEETFSGPRDVYEGQGHLQLNMKLMIQEIIKI